MYRSTTVSMVCVRASAAVLLHRFIGASACSSQSLSPEALATMFLVPKGGTVTRRCGCILRSLRAPHWSLAGASDQGPTHASL